MKKKKLENLVEMVLGDSEALTFEDNSIDAVTVWFGVRNFEDLEKGMGEILRVLRPGKAAVILEPAIHQIFPNETIILFVLPGVLPLIGKLVSKDNAAYTYLPESVKAFPDGKEFTDICRKVGFKKAEHKRLSLGICSMYLLEK